MIGRKHKDMRDKDMRVDFYGHVICAAISARLDKDKDKWMPRKLWRTVLTSSKVEDRSLEAGNSFKACAGVYHSHSSIGSVRGCCGIDIGRAAGGSLCICGMNKLDSGMGLGGRGGPGLSTASGPLCGRMPHSGCASTIEIGSGGGGSTLPNLEHRPTHCNTQRPSHHVLIKGVDPSHEVL
jgi:hypothetical protein